MVHLAVFFHHHGRVSHARVLWISDHADAEFSYDTALMGSLFGFPAFNRAYGKILPSGEYQVSSAWQAGLMNGAQAGSMLGLFINGIMCDMIGYKKTYMIALALMTGAICLPFFSDGSIPILMAGQVISGIPCE